VTRPTGFMHVPKTGGNSVFHVITTNLPSLTICPSPRLGVWNYISDTPHYDLYAGHFDYDFFNHIGRNPVKLTMVRDPVARIISLYDFWRGFQTEDICEITKEIPDNGPRFASSVGFDAFVNEPTPFVRTHVENGMTRQLLGALYDELLCNPAEMINEAYQRLVTFDWIGITEDFNRSVQRLADLLGFQLASEIPRLNDSYAGTGRRNITPTNPTGATVALIERRNSADVEIYQRALSFLS
jgi:hypothetical protein